MLKMQFQFVFFLSLALFCTHRGNLEILGKSDFGHWNYAEKTLVGFFLLELSVTHLCSLCAASQAHVPQFQHTAFGLESVPICLSSLTIVTRIQAEIQKPSTFTEAGTNPQQCSTILQSSPLSSSGFSCWFLQISAGPLPCGDRKHFGCFVWKVRAPKLPIWIARVLPYCNEHRSWRWFQIITNIWSLLLPTSVWEKVITRYIFIFWKTESNCQAIRSVVPLCAFFLLLR